MRVTATILLVTVAMVLGAPGQALAAIGCTLSNPAEDLKYLYPDMTSYKEDLKQFPQLDAGEKLFKALQQRLGSDLDPIYETYETPYTIYSVFKGDTKIGIVHGVNVPGKGGVIQVFLSLDESSGEIRGFFFQRLESPAATQLRNKAFRKQFEHLSLADFYKHDYYTVAEPRAEGDKIGKLEKPAGLSTAGEPDYQATLRGLRKNLILLDFFVYGRRFEPFFAKAQQALKQRTREKKP